MIERVWRGWTSEANRDVYAAFLRDTFLPAAHAIPGYLGARVLRRQVGDEWEYMTITHFESLDAIRAFAGDDLEAAHIAPEARNLLSRWDERVAHYEIAFDDREAEAGTSSPDAARAAQKGMDEMSKRFHDEGGEIYLQTE